MFYFIQQHIPEFDTVLHILYYFEPMSKIIIVISRSIKTKLIYHRCMFVKITLM